MDSPRAVMTCEEPAFAGRHVLQPYKVRLSMPVHSYGPLVVGIGTAVLARLAIDLDALSSVRAVLADAPAWIALLWAVPVLVGAGVSCTRTSYVEISAAGVQVAPFLGAARWYNHCEVVSWGFGLPSGSQSYVPPRDCRAVPFVLQTADGWSLHKTVTAAMAVRLATFLVPDGPTGAE
jgi:hypothetical protein